MKKCFEWCKPLKLTQETSRPRHLQWWIQRENDINYIRTLQRNAAWKDNIQTIIWIQHYFDTKSRQRHYKKKKTVEYSSQTQKYCQHKFKQIESNKAYIKR